MSDETLKSSILYRINPAITVEIPNTNTAKVCSMDPATGSFGTMTTAEVGGGFSGELVTSGPPI